MSKNHGYCVQHIKKAEKTWKPLLQSHSHSNFLNGEFQEIVFPSKKWASSFLCSTLSILKLLGEVLEKAIICFWSSMKEPSATSWTLIGPMLPLIRNDLYTAESCCRQMSSWQRDDWHGDIYIECKRGVVSLLTRFVSPCIAAPLWGSSHLSTLKTPGNEDPSRLLNPLQQYSKDSPLCRLSQTTCSEEAVQTCVGCLTHDAALSTAVINQLSWGPLSNSFL